MSPYPKFVWSPTGGWYCNPPNWKRNTGLATLFVLASSGVMWYVSAQLEVGCMSFSICTVADPRFVFL